MTSALIQKRFARFKSNRRSWIASWLFCGVLILALGAPFLASERPIFVWFEGRAHWPLWCVYPETDFGGEFTTEAQYRDPIVQDLIARKGWILWAPIRYGHDTVNYDLPSPAPSPPSRENPLGTDGQGRDVCARLLHGLRVSLLFALGLTAITAPVGIFMGALQGYCGGRVDLFLQRLIEIWSGLPLLFILIILGSFVDPNVWWLLATMSLFSWMSLASLVRGECLRVRNLDYVRAAQALGLRAPAIVWRHVLPNAMVAAVSYIPFMLSSAVAVLTSLDFLGFGLPPGSASLGELLAQGKKHLHAPWLGITAFGAVAFLLTLLIFIGEGVRDAFDPRKEV